MATMPRLDVPSTMNKPGPWVVQPINPLSDGDPSKWKPPPYRAISNDAYRVKIGAMWAEHKGLGTAGINYYLDRLPNGYQFMDYPKPGDDSIRYKRLFGHPSGRFFDSQPRFFVHFLWLMDGMKGDCQCMLCNKNQKPGRPAASLKQKPRAPRDIARRDAAVDMGKRAKPVVNYFAKELYEQRDKRPSKSTDQFPTDEEGTPDIYKTLIELLYRHRDSRKLIDEDIEEKASPDWRAEHNEKYGDSFKILSAHLTNVLLQHSFVPRLGELVLWCPDHPDDVDIIYNPESHSYQFYSAEREQFHGFPRWRAGLVTQVPSIDDNIDFPDVLCFVERKESLNKAGFRVETFPDPNNDVDKSASKQYKYVPLRQIRPLNHWQNLLRGIPEKKLDPSIKFALTCMISLSLFEKYRFTGKWPEASIFCRGIYLGAELLIEGDAVRILPPQDTAAVNPLACTDVLVISSIRLHLHDIKEEHTKYSSPQICSTSSITLVGKAYTLDPSRAYKQTSTPSKVSGQPEPIPVETLKWAFPTVGAASYGQWYALHGPGEKYEITYDRVLGRLYEAGAMGMWSGLLGNHITSKIPPSLSYDLTSVLAGRRYGTLADERIPEFSDGKIHWFWADTRVQALSLETVNGLEVGAYDSVRDLTTMRAWRARLKILDGNFTPEDSKDSMLARQKGRPKGSRVVGGMVIGPDEESENDEVDTPPRGSFSEAIRSKKGVGGMVGAGAVLQEDEDGADKEVGSDDTADDDDDEEEEEEEEEKEEEEESTYPSKVNIMKPEWESAGFVIPDDPDIDMPPPPPPKSKRPTSQLSPEFRGPTKARKSTGGPKISSIHAGRYDNSITPAMTQRMDNQRWKGKGRADTASEDWDPAAPFESVEPDNAIPVDDEQDQGEDEDEEGDEDDEDDEDEGYFYQSEKLVEPEPKDDDDYDEDDEDDEDGDTDDDEEKERIRTLASFQKSTFDRTGKKMKF